MRQRKWYKKEGDKDKQRALQVPTYTYARMTRHWRSAPNTDTCHLWFLVQVLGVLSHSLLFLSILIVYPYWIIVWVTAVLSLARNCLTSKLSNVREQGLTHNKFIYSLSALEKFSYPWLPPYYRLGQCDLFSAEFSLIRPHSFLKNKNFVFARLFPS